jgi:hypothetical protein
MRTLLILALALAASLAAVPVASATSVAVRTDPGGALLGGATTLQWTSTDQLTLFTLGGTVRCTHSAIDLTLAANSGATTVPGQLNALTFGACSGSLAGMGAITSCALHAVVPIWLDSTATGGTLHAGATMRCPIDGSFPAQACYYRWLMTLTYNNSSGAVTWPLSGVSAVSPTADAAPTANCLGLSGSMIFQGSWTGLVDQAGAKVTVTTS